ncbi:unnamed protein product [Adineta steineri]|uniref:Methyltransferase domain-containing protein n=1 Tax=Adineta steineri TaxID=433720 RepID=A0A816F6R3_9BILA|nr:unnamed protein product [Adineta steineri]CAF1657232.1 unnamed protein product [Adineta steineri]
MLESDGWFCDQDSNWKRRKMIDHMQNKLNRISNDRPSFFQNNWEPTLHCEFARRIGHTGDGGKWICDIHRYQEMTNTTMLIYSLGSNGDFSFERAVKNELPNAEIYTFDRDIYQCPANICISHQANLGSQTADSSKSLQTIINELGHQKREIHILKVDIEGSEFDLFEELFKSGMKNQSDSLYIRQILFEIHLAKGLHEEPSQRTHRLFDLFRANNYAIFHKEVNLYDAQNLCEFALLRLNAAFFSSIT